MPFRPCNHSQTDIIICAHINFLFPSQSRSTTPPNDKTQSAFAFRLNGGLVGERNDGLGEVVLGADAVGFPGLGSLSLQVDVGAGLLGLTLLGGVGLDAEEELLTGAGEVDVLDANVDALLDVAVADLLVDDDTDGGLGDVVDDAGLTVVDLVRHTIAFSVLVLVLIHIFRRSMKFVSMKCLGLSFDAPDLY